jgi:hypothetical protein
MKAFKDKAKLPPVDKIRKDLGRFQEKLDRKVHTSAPKQAVVNKPLMTHPANYKKRVGLGAYFILFLIIVLSILFIFLIFTSFINKNYEI